MASTSGRSPFTVISSRPSSFSRLHTAPLRRTGRCHALTDNENAAVSRETNKTSLPSLSPRKALVDPYRAAGQRLQSLLSGLGDGEEELLNMMLMEESVDRKVTIALIAGIGISTVACFGCWICGLDPAGGASLSLNTLRAAAIGGAAAVPLVALKAALWSDAARKALPFLEEMQQRQIEEFEPILYRLTPAQTLLVMGSEVIPGLLILLPAATGGAQKLLEMYLSFAGVDSPGLFPAVVAISIAAFLVSAAKLVELTPSEEEYDLVKDAIDNSDRFYKIMGQGIDSGAAEAAASAAAFRAVAVTWLARRQVAARFGAVMTVVEVVFLGSLWHVTDDLAAPLVAGLAAAGVDFAWIRKSMPSAQGKDGTSAW